MRSPVADLLADLSHALEGLGVRWYLFGAQAAIVHGAARLTADVDVTVQRTQPTPTLDLAVRIEDTELPAMNAVLQAHGGFDVAAGRFSVYTELHVRDGRVQGYVKPLFVDVDVYDSRQEAADSPVHRLYEGVIGGIATIMRNQPRDQVATRTDLSGQLDDPRADTIEIVLQLVRNAFFKAILPGLEPSRRTGRSGDDHRDSGG